jgi:hypothetical protein
VLPLRKATQPGAPPLVEGDTRFLFPTDLARRVGRKYRPEGQLYVATPAVLRYLGIDPATIGRGTDFIVDRGVRTEGLFIVSMKSPEELAVTNVQRIEIGQHLFGFDSARNPPSFITIGGLRRHGLQQIAAGWLVESNAALTSNQIADARGIAADAGSRSRSRRKRPPTRR